MRKTTLKALLPFLFSFIIALSACKNEISMTEEISGDCECRIYIQLPAKTASPILPDSIWYTLIAAQEEIEPHYDPITKKLSPVLDYIETTDNKDNTNYYTMKLPNGNWYFYIEGYTSNDERTQDTRILYGKTSIAENVKGNHYDVTLNVNFIPTGNGKINLPIDVTQTTINKLEITNTNGVLDGIYEAKEIESENNETITTIPIQKDNIPAGVYEATLTFYQDDVLIFKILNETINVKDNVTTNSWLYSENREYLEKREVHHTPDTTAFPKPEDDDSYTQTANFVVTPEYLHKKCNTSYYVSRNGDSKNTGTAYKPYKTIQEALDRTKALNDNFYKGGIKEETFTIILMNELNDENNNYSAHQTDNPINLVIKPYGTSVTCQTHGKLTFGKNYNITIAGESDSYTDGSESQKFIFADIETESPISINKCKIIGNLTINDSNTTESTIYKSIIGVLNETENIPVDIKISKSKVSFINPDKDLEEKDRGSETNCYLNNLEISDASNVTFCNYETSTTSIEKVTVLKDFKILNSSFTISETILNADNNTTEINGCKDGFKVIFGQNTKFSTYACNITESDVQINLNSTSTSSTAPAFTAKGDIIAENSMLTVEKSNIKAADIELNNCNSKFETIERSNSANTLTGNIKLIGGDTSISYYGITKNYDFILSDKAILKGKMLHMGESSSNALRNITCDDSEVTLNDTLIYYNTSFKINSSKFTLDNAEKDTKQFGGKASFEITNSPKVLFNKVDFTLNTIPSLEFDNSKIEINNSNFIGKITNIKNKTEISFINTALDSDKVANIFSAEESTKLILSGSTAFVNSNSQINLSDKAKVYVQNPPEDKTKNYAKLLALNPVNQSILVMLDENKKEIDFLDDFEDGDIRYTLENVGFKLTFNNSETKRKGMIAFDSESLLDLHTGWGARLRTSSAGTGPQYIIAAEYVVNRWIPPEISFYTFTEATDTKIIGGLWSNSTNWSGGTLFNNITQINYTLFYDTEILHSQTYTAPKTMFILGDWDPDIESRLGSQDSIQYNIRMTFSLTGTNAGSYTCNIPLIVTKN